MAIEMLIDRIENSPELTYEGMTMWDGLTASPEHIVWVDAETKMTLAEAKREQRPLLTSNYPYKLF